MRTPAVLIAAALAVTACGGAKPKPAPAKPDPVAAAADAAPVVAADPPIVPADAPPSVLGIVSMPKPMSFVASVSAYMAKTGARAPAPAGKEVMARGVGALLGVHALAGIDWERPMFALYVEVDGGDEPWATVLPVADEAVLVEAFAEVEGIAVRVHDGYALVGAPDVVAEVANYALGTLRPSSVLTDTTIIVRMEPIMARYGTYLDSMMPLIESAIAADPDNVAAPAAMMMGRGMLGFARQLQEVRAAIRFEADDAEMRVEFVAAPDTTAAAFMAKQVPASYAIASRLPGSAAPVLMAGRLSFESDGDIGKAWADMTASMIASGDADVAKAYAEWFELFSGEWAATASFSDGMAMSMVTETAEGSAHVDTLRRTFGVLAKSKSLRAATYKKVGTPRFRFKKVPVDEYRITTDLSKLPEDQRAASEQLGTVQTVMWAQTGGAFVYAFGKKAVARAAIQKMIETVIAKDAVLFKGWSELFEASRANRESFLMTIDLGAIAAIANPALASAGAPPVQLGVGFDQRSLRLRFRLPAQTIKGIGGFGGGANEGTELVAQFDELADRACACEDKDCAKKIGEDMMAILEGVDKDDEPSLENQEKIMAAMDRIQVCTTKLTQ